MANLSNINNKFLFTDGDFLKIGNLAPINNISGTESGISVTNSNVASITLDNTAASGKRYVMYSSGNGSLVFWDGDAGSARLQIDTSGNSTFAGDIMPAAENLYDIGSAAVRWEDVYADQVYGRSVYVDEYVYHNGDTNNFIRFQASRMTLQSKASGGAKVDLHDNGQVYLNSGGGTALTLDTSQNATFAGTVLIEGVSNYTGLEVKGSGASRPQIKFSNVNQGVLGQIFGTEANSLVVTTPAGLEYKVRNANGASGDHVFKSYNTAILTLDGGTNNATLAGNLTLSVASSFINTASGDLYINPASNNTTLYDGANAQIFNVYNAGNLAIKLNAGTGGGVLLARDGINFESSYSGNGLVLSHHGIGPSNAIVSGNSVYPDNLFINSGGAASDWSNVTIYGNVGIGTTGPGSKLEIFGGGNTLRMDSAGNTAKTFLMRNVNTAIAEIKTDGNLDINIEDPGRTMRFLNGNTERMRITSGGNVGINYTGPFNQLSGTETTLAISNSNVACLYLDNTHVNGHKYILTSGTDGAFAVYDKTAGLTRLVITNGGYLKSPETYNLTTSSAANMHVDSNGFFYRSTSSLKYKTDVKDYDKGLNEVMQLQPKYYKGKDDGDKQFVGLIAEDVHDLGLTEFVQYADDGSPDALSYSHMIALLTKSIQELKADNNSLKARIETLENN
jgi:hypothetical protein